MENNAWKASQICGSEVFDTEGNLIGVLSDILPSGSNDIWVVKTVKVSSGEILVPALKGVVKSVDTGARRIVVDLPPGLKDIYDERKDKAHDED
ncbi:MAG: PRC-barrel domain-containing protein [Endomicrobiales bacterium]|nr:PRC-barrel domain-containing protein [Endomicrobiales bacterium]